MSTHRNPHIPVLIVLAIFMAFMGQQYLSKDEGVDEGCRVTVHGHLYCLKPAETTAN
jgi:hypothetical protein